MSISSRQSELFCGGDWKVLYQAFTQINFNASDPITINQALRTYIQQNYPEDFNDWIIQSEFVAIIDLLSWLAGTLAFKTDISVRENFLEVAEARESILRLARFLSYNPARNQTSAGVAKIVAISTDDDVLDSFGTNLNSTTVVWNDPNNTNWQEQFTDILNNAFVTTNPYGVPLKQGTVAGIATQLYRLNSYSAANSFGFSSIVAGTPMDFEICNGDFTDAGTVWERVPDPTNAFQFYYLSDGQGNASANTGFFMLFKQGSTRQNIFSLPYPVQNQIIDITSTNVNNTDVWVQTVSDSNAVLTNWTQVPVMLDSNITYNALPLNKRNIFSVLTRDSDAISIRFSDGLFGNAPTGLLSVTYRISNGLSYTINPLDIDSVQQQISFTNPHGVSKKLFLTFSLQSAVSNATPAETIEQIRLRAPMVYATQNRMVSGEDYNTFPLQTNLAVKIKAVNRVYSGQSRYIDLHDPTGTYQDLSVFADDGILFRETADVYTEVYTTMNLTPSEIIEGYIQPALNSTEAVNSVQDIMMTGVLGGAITFPPGGVASPVVPQIPSPVVPQIPMAYWTGISFGGGIFCAVTPYAFPYACSMTAVSPDGATWTVGYLPGASFTSVAFANGYWFAFFAEPVTTCAKCANGLWWSPLWLGGTSDTWLNAVYGNGVYVVIGQSHSLTSTNGTVWTSHALAFQVEGSAMAFGAGLFVVNETGGGLYTSPDGAVWTHIAKPSWFHAIWDSVAYGNGRFVAASAGLAQTWTSTDGFAWTEGSLPEFSRPNAVTFGNGQFVALLQPINSYPSPGPIPEALFACDVATSPDGLTWTLQGTIPNLPGPADTSPMHFVWNQGAAGNGITVVVGGPTQQAAFSSDCVAWAMSPLSLPGEAVSAAGTVTVTGSVPAPAAEFVGGAYPVGTVTVPDGMTWTESQASLYSSTGWFNLNSVLVVEGAMIRFLLPTGKYQWVAVAAVSNAINVAAATNTAGPVTLAEPIATGSVVAAILPAYASTLPMAAVTAIQHYISLKLSFSLSYNYGTGGWNVGPAATALGAPVMSSILMLTCNYFSQLWQITSRGLRYVFESITTVEWFDNGTRAIDEHSGAASMDLVRVMKINENLNDPAGKALRRDYDFTIDEIWTYLDGAPEPRRTTVVFTDSNADGCPDDPDTFYRVVSNTATDCYLFWAQGADENDYPTYSVIGFDTEAILLASPPPALLTEAFVVAGSSAFSNFSFWMYTSTGWVQDFSGNYCYRFGRGPNIAASWTSATGAVTNPYGDQIAFHWKHYAPSSHRLDPSSQNINDIFVLTYSYDAAVRQWIANGGTAATIPSPPTELDLSVAFSGMETYRMFSDAIIWRPVRYKFLFGVGASSTLQMQFKVVAAPNAAMSNGQIQTSIVNAINAYFAVTNWDFGDTFYWSELCAYIHIQLATNISSIVPVPLNQASSFGDGFEIPSGVDEIFISTAQVSNVVIVDSNTPTNLRISQ